MARKRPRTEPEPRLSVVISTETALVVRQGIQSYIENCQRADIDAVHAAVPRFLGLLAECMELEIDGQVTLKGKDCNFAAVTRFCHAKQIKGSLPLCNAIVQARLPKPKDESALYTEMLVREYGHKPGKGTKCDCERCENLKAAMKE